MHTFFVVIGGLGLLGLSSATPAGQLVEVRLEPFPPFVYRDGGGLAIELLEQVEEVSDLRFHVRIMPYSRGRFELRTGEADLLGPVPLGLETESFYDWAAEMDWALETRSDLFFIDPAYLYVDDPGRLRIGVPRGNGDFFSELSGIERHQFTESDLVNLAQMLAAGRIDALLFERASTFRTLTTLGIDGVYYRNLFSIPAGFAVRNDGPGRTLGKKLDRALEALDTEAIARAYGYYLDMPPEGVVSLSPRLEETE